MENLFKLIFGEVHGKKKKKKGKSPNQRTKKLSFVAEGFFLLRFQYNKERERPQERKGFGKQAL